MNDEMKMFIIVHNVADKDLEIVLAVGNTTPESEKIMMVNYSVQKNVLPSITQKLMKKEK